METFYRIFQTAGMLISLACCVIVIKEKPSRIQQKLLMTCIWGLIATFGNFIEVFALSTDSAMIALKIAYIGKCYIVMSALMFASSYGGIKLPKGLIPFLAAANTLVLALVITCERHKLFYTSLDNEIRENSRMAVIVEHGVFFYIWKALLLVTVGIYIVIVGRRMRRCSRAEKYKMAAIFSAMAMPLAAEIAFIILRPVYFDVTTFAITMTEVCFLIAVKRYGLLDTIELAQERILDDIRDGVIVIDSTKSVILYMNRVAESFVGRMTDINGVLDIERLTQEDESVFELEDRHYEFRVSEIIRSKGSSEVQGYVVWIFDMTFIDEYTSEMIRLKDDAERANQVKTDFLANISHEIRTPMNSIMGYAELALQNKDANAMHGYLKKIKQSSNILLHLINELIDITKIESGRMKISKVHYRFTEMIDEIKHMLEIPAGRAGLAFMIHLDSEMPEYFHDDKVKVEEIIMNLVTNSIKYTHQGHIILKLRLKEIAGNRAAINIEVEDTGIGMNETDSELMFAKFERVDRKKNYRVSGSGLGLPIVKSFVDMLDGSISYESEPGVGTRFIVDIWQELDSNRHACDTETNAEPQQAGEAENSEAESDSADASESVLSEEAVINGGHVLIVDDNLLNLEVASSIMELMGMTTRTAESGMECLEILKNGEKPDIIFLDYMMPEMDGLATMKNIRVLDIDAAKAPIVLLTANAVAGVREEMIDVGFDDFLSKPIELDELKRVLIRYLGEKK